MEAWNVFGAADIALAVGFDEPRQAEDRADRTLRCGFTRTPPAAESRRGAPTVIMASSKAKRPLGLDG